MNYFRYKQFNKDVITVAVGYYLRYALSYRDRFCCKVRKI
ncbi:transposase-like protein [Staphylococcus epidermidis]